MSQKNSNVSIRIPKILQKQLNNKKIGKIYKNFEKNLNLDKNFAVAVSGGPDSLALAVLAKIYASKKRLVSKFFIVDHQIRKESSQEAKLTRKKLSSVGINSQILIWKGKNLKEKAYYNNQNPPAPHRSENIQTQTRHHEFLNL